MVSGPPSTASTAGLQSAGSAGPGDRTAARSSQYSTLPGLMPRTQRPADQECGTRKALNPQRKAERGGHGEHSAAAHRDGLWTYPRVRQALAIDGDLKGLGLLVGRLTARRRRRNRGGYDRTRRSLLDRVLGVHAHLPCRSSRVEQAGNDCGAKDHRPDDPEYSVVLRAHGSHAFETEGGTFSLEPQFTLTAPEDSPDWTPVPDHAARPLPRSTGAESTRPARSRPCGAPRLGPDPRAARPCPPPRRCGWASCARRARRHPPPRA